MTKAEFIAWATSRGWTQDRWGHLHSKGGNYRLKLSSIAVRYERKTGAGWIRLASNFFSRLEISSEGKLLGLLANGCGSDKPASAEAIMGAL